MNQTRIFKFLSSVRLAVPLMIVIIIAIATGTILESMYSSTYARLAVYGSAWFFALMVLLWINIFSAMISRYPWKKHHLGFVITHIGLLTLLAGGFSTSEFGVDGSLQVQENTRNSTVILPRLMIGYQLDNSPSVQSVAFDRTLFEKSASGLGFINDQLSHVFTVERYLPFAQVEKGYVSGQDANGPVAVSFILKSQFFNVSEWLHSADNPEMQLGPARLRLIIDDGQQKSAAAEAPAVPAKKQPRQPASAKVKKAAASSGGAEELVVRDQASQKEIKRISIDSLAKAPLTVNGITITLKERMRHATVANNKLTEDPSGDGPPNPALVVLVAKGSESHREILYAKFPDFSLNKDGNFGLALSYQAPIAAAVAAASEPAAAEEEASGLPAGHPAMAAGGGSDSAPRNNIIEFHIDRAQPQSVRVVLLKNGAKAGERTLKEGESFQTPWMGMTIFIGSIVSNSQAETRVTAVKPEPGRELPPSAMYLKPAGAVDGFWLAQGEQKSVTIANKRVTVIFANETLELPFEIALEKFTKVDYPGTEMAMSFESLVRLKDEPNPIKISMNEPLKKDGFTLYQASYQLTPGQPPVSVFSVNRDPGRGIKYIGSVILAIGIVTFTLMRSRLARRRENE